MSLLNNSGAGRSSSSSSELAVACTGLPALKTDRTRSQLLSALDTRHVKLRCLHSLARGLPALARGRILWASDLVNSERVARIRRGAQCLRAQAQAHSAWLTGSARPSPAPQRVLSRQASSEGKVGDADRQRTQAHRRKPPGQRLGGCWWCSRRRSDCCSHDWNQTPARRQESRRRRSARARRRRSRRLRGACCSCCGCRGCQGGGEAGSS